MLVNRGDNREDEGGRVIVIFLVVLTPEESAKYIRKLV